MRPVAEKKLADGSVVRVLLDHFHAFYVGKSPDDDLARVPMGAFASEGAARAWADHAFAGGEWRAIIGG